MFSRSSLRFLRRNISYLHRPGDGAIKNVTLIKGVGVGPEITTAVQKVFDAAHCPIHWDVIESFNFEDPNSQKLLRKNDAILLGVANPIKGTRYSENVKFYKSLDLFANVVHAFSIPGIEKRHKNVDIVIIRENTEGEYSGVEHEVYPGVTESLKIMTKKNSLRIADFAFEYAYLAGRKKVTAVHKANIMKLADGLFLEATREVAKNYPFLEYEEMIIDNCAMQLVKNPWQFDVMVLPNLYGSIVQNIAAGITGGPGLTPGANIGERYCLFEQGCRHTGYDIAGKDIANPSALIYSSCLMLRRLNLPRFADVIENAVNCVLAEQKIRTKDIGGHNTCTDFTEEVCTKILGKAQTKRVHIARTEF